MKSHIGPHFVKGMYHGLPIALGYLSVSFGFGILAFNSGLSVFEAAMISVTNLTSAGQAAGVAIIAAGGMLTEMILTQFIINIRYALMSLSLSQKLDSSFTTPHRLLASFGITDEIFAVASAQPGKISPPYMYGMIFVAWVGWTAGTIMGAAAGELLPASVTNAMGIVLYGMFLAIIIPPAAIIERSARRGYRRRNKHSFQVPHNRRFGRICGNHKRGRCFGCRRAYIPR